MYEFLVNDSTASKPDKQQAYWYVLIVDDEPAIHTITKFALEDEYFDGMPLAFISAFGAQEAKEILSERDDIALVLLDVVMETDTAGLDVARWIREDLGNNLIRIILRTGQPGQAPENTVILDYDIFDYKNKTELTAQKLFSCVVSGLRSYRDVLALSNHSHGLKRVVQATADLFKRQYAREYASGVLLQLTSLLYDSADAALINVDANISDGLDSAKIIAAVGCYEKHMAKSVSNVLPPEAIQKWLLCEDTIYSGQSDNKILFSYRTRDNHKTLLCLNCKSVFSDDDMSLIELFVQSVAIAQERVRYWQDTEDTLNEMINLLSKTFEDHAKEGDYYFTGVTKVAMLMAKKHGLILKREINERQTLKKL
jgi:CheY-like chemotaxis protein